MKPKENIFKDKEMMGYIITSMSAIALFFYTLSKYNLQIPF